MKLSIVTTLYFSSQYIEKFYRRVSEVAGQVTEEYEIIFVNDGSPDDSLRVALELHRRDRRVTVIDLSRNFGHHKAVMTGLAEARGDLVFLIDVDLEEEPEILSIFYEKMMIEEVDVVYGVQESRKGGVVERISGDLFYLAFNALSNYPVPRNVVTARLMSRRYVAALVQHRDKEIFLAGLWAITGFEQLPVTITKKSKGSTSYNLSRKISILVNSITSFSSKPLSYIFYIGCLIILFSGIAAIYLIIRRLFFGVLLAGWASLMVSIWFLGGLTVFSLGVVGIYISRVFAETKDRPYTVIREIYRWEGNGEKR